MRKTVGLKNQTIKFIDALNAETELPVETLIEIADDLYKATPHFERPLSNKVLGKIFKNAAEPRSDEFDSLAKAEAHKN